MPLTLYVDGPRWRRHLTATLSAEPDLVPVIKGNGYGYGVGRLARRADWLGARMVAVGTYAEVNDVSRRYAGDIMVLAPWRPFLPDVQYGSRIIHTVGRAHDLTQLAAAAQRPRIVLEGLTSMRRHGLEAQEFERFRELARVGRAAPGLRLEGYALHLPLAGNREAEAERWVATDPTARWYVSHLTAQHLADLRRRHGEAEFRPRVGTDLWLGDYAFLSERATVLDVHAVRRGDRVGYRQRLVTHPGWVVVVAGGTSQGIGLDAPTAAATLRQRAVALARGGLDATGRALSPFFINGKYRWFVEPPHMQVSMVFVPAEAGAPEVGDEVPVRVRHTATWFDRVVIT
jgi:alanine racemase